MPSFTPEQAAALLDADPGYRVLRALPPLHTLILPDPHGTVRTALVVDTETTSLDCSTGRIIQVAACPILFDNKGRVVGIGRTQSWLEDPGEPLNREITQLTGLSDADLAGQRIDDAAVAALLENAEVVVAHSAAFDRPWWERRFDLARPKRWACSLREVDWRGHSYEGRGVGALLAEVGHWFNARHRADADVDALVALLTAALPNGRTVASELLLTASRPTWRIAATRAPYEAKERLRRRGYRWSSDRRVWRVEVSEDKREAELAWLADEADCACPTVERVTWLDRHR